MDGVSGGIVVSFLGGEEGESWLSAACMGSGRDKTSGVDILRAREARRKLFNV